MSTLLTALILLTSINASADAGITPLQLSQATLDSVKSVVRKEKITVDKIQVTGVNTEYRDPNSMEELLEIRLNFVSVAGPVKAARFLCHAVDHAIHEVSAPHCHRVE